MRIILNFIALIYLLDDVKRQSNWIQNSDKVLISTIESNYSTVGWSLLGASLVLYYISYQHQRHHLTKRIEKTGELPMPTVLYFTCHCFSLVNFSFDFPGWGIPTVLLSRIIVVAINIVAIACVLFFVFLETPFALAWGCYAPYLKYKDYDYGVCPAFLDRQYSSACDQPGVNCAKQLDTETSEFNHVKAFTQMALTVSFAVYFISVQKKVGYFKEEIKRVGYNKKKDE